MDHRKGGGCAGGGLLPTEVRPRSGAAPEPSARGAVSRGAGVVCRPAHGDHSRLNLHVMLRALPTSVRTARRFVRQVLAEVGLEQLADSAEPIASELVTNSVNAVAGGVSWVTVSVYVGEARVRLEVWDQSPVEPVRRAAGLDENGRGLEIVEALCTRWGCRWPEVGGKSVWCELTTGPR